MDGSLLQVCSFESRRRDEMANLIRRAGGVPTIAPSMREIALTDNLAPFEFADRLLNGRIDVVIFMTGVGTETLFAVLATRSLDHPVLAKLNECLIVARGPKPAAVLSKMKVRIDIKAPEPNTWEEVIQELDRKLVDVRDKMVAVQEYGQPSEALYAWLQSQGAMVLPVPVYRWELPDDLQPLQQAIRDTIAGKFDVLLWTSAQQLNHVLEAADALGLKQAWLAAANRCAIGSIGPTASERLHSLGLPPDVEPSHPKMAHLARETLSQAPDILKTKRS